MLLECCQGSVAELSLEHRAVKQQACVVVCEAVHTLFTSNPLLIKLVRAVAICCYYWLVRAVAICCCYLLVRAAAICWCVLVLSVGAIFCCCVLLLSVGACW